MLSNGLNSRQKCNKTCKLILLSNFSVFFDDCQICVENCNNNRHNAKPQGRRFGLNDETGWNILVIGENYLIT